MGTTEKSQKTNVDRIGRIKFLADRHFGEESKVSLELADDGIWTAKIKLNKRTLIGDIYEKSFDPTQSLKRLKNRIKKIIKRYNLV